MTSAETDAKGVYVIKRKRVLSGKSVGIHAVSSHQILVALYEWFYFYFFFCGNARHYLAAVWLHINFYLSI